MGGKDNEEFSMLMTNCHLVQFDHDEDVDDRMVAKYERNWHEVESVYEAVEGVSKSKKFWELF